MIFEEYKSQFNKFVDQPVGRGGYKEVYLAEHADYGDVVIKLFSHDVDERAMREISLLKENDFYHVPSLFQTDSIEYQGRETIATVEQFVRGDGLRNVITSGHKYSFPETCEFLKQALTFVDSIWQKEIVHRDLKPENIILDDNGDYHFIDFGAARDLAAETLTNSVNAMPCTVGYAAPEVLKNDSRSIDSRSDLFSVGVVAYELVTGENPFAKRALGAIQIALNTLTITPAQVSIEGDGQHRLIGLISAMMNRSRLSRPKDAQQALKFLEIAKESYVRA